MMRGSAIGFGCTAFLLLSISAAGAERQIVASASGDQLTVPSGSAAIGDARMRYDDDTGQFLIDVKIRGLTASDVTGSFIQLGQPGTDGPVLYTIGSSYSTVPDGIEFAVANQTFPAGNVSDLFAGGTYLRVTTVAHPGGEIRGQLLPSLRRVDYPIGGSGTVLDGHALVATADGGFVALWGGAGGTIVGRRFGADGAALTGVFTVGTGVQPDAAALPDGFVVAWQQGSDIVERRFASSGTPLTPQLTVATPVADQQVAIASAPDGKFVVVWVALNDGNVWARRFDSAGAALGSPIQVSATPAIDQSPDVAEAELGAFLVTWSYFNDPSLHAVARAFDATGTATTPFEFAVNDGSAQAFSPHVGVRSPSGEYVVVWSENETANRGRRFTIDGAAVGASFPLDAGGPRDSPEISRAPDGEFIIAVPTDGDVVVRRFGRDGSPSSAESRAKATPGGSPTRPRVAIGPRGEGWVTWTDGNEALVADRIPARQALWSANEGHGVRVSDRAGDSDDAGTRISPGWGNGISGTGLIFDGTDDFVRLFSGGDPQIAGASVSVTAWVKLTFLPSAIDENFQGIYDSAADSYVLYLDRANQELRFKATTTSLEAHRPGIPQAMLRVGEWMYVAGVYDGPAGEARIYLDGQLVDTESFSATGMPVFAATGVPSIGRDGANFQYFFYGSIDEVEVWDRVVEPDEIIAESGRRFDDTFESGNLLAWASRSP